MLRAVPHRPTKWLIGSGVMPPADMWCCVCVLCRTPGATRWAGPALGQHTDEILRGELGMADSEIAALRAKGAI
jgi:crotonobetainyl-CoA:carnitine CoA-transferase CaiB-like acyl-CoA transferase